MAQPELKPEEIAYAALWRFLSTDPVLSAARRQLLEVIGGLHSEGQRRAVKWAVENFPPVSEVEIIAAIDFAAQASQQGGE